MPDRRHSAWAFKLAVEASRRPLAQQTIVDELRRVILDGAVPPGTPIPVSEVADSSASARFPSARASRR